MAGGEQWSSCRDRPLRSSRNDSSRRWGPLSGRNNIDRKKEYQNDAGAAEAVPKLALAASECAKTTTGGGFSAARRPYTTTPSSLPRAGNRFCFPHRVHHLVHVWECCTLLALLDHGVVIHQDGEFPACPIHFLNRNIRFPM